MKFRRLLSVLFFLLLCQLPLLAQSTLVCDRPLPIANLNNAAGALRSNVAWSFGNDWITGDDCIPGLPGETYIVTRVIGWSVQGTPDVTRMGDRFQSISLYLGRPSEDLAEVATGNLALGSDTNSNANIAHTPVTYSNGDDYQGSSTSFIQLWENDFQNLVFPVNGGEKLYFSGDGILQDDVNYNWFNHASNKGLSGNVQQDADDHFLGWDRNDLATASAYPWNSDNVGDGGDGGWDKSSDLNVLVYAELLGEGMATGGGWFIPEPATIQGLADDGSRATFGFIARRKGSANTGNLEFQYHSPSSGINLKSSSYDWVQVATTQAVFEGTGTINGIGDYKFRVRAVDGDKLGGGVSDRFEIRIWTTGGSFDGPTHRAEGDLSGGQIVVHKK